MKSGPVVVGKVAVFEPERCCIFCQQGNFEAPDAGVFQGNEFPLDADGQSGKQIRPVGSCCTDQFGVVEINGNAIAFDGYNRGDSTCFCG